LIEVGFALSKGDAGRRPGVSACTGPMKAAEYPAAPGLDLAFRKERPVPDKTIDWLLTFANAYTGDQEPDVSIVPAGMDILVRIISRHFVPGYFHSVPAGPARRAGRSSSARDNFDYRSTKKATLKAAFQVLWETYKLFYLAGLALG